MSIVRMAGIIINVQPNQTPLVFLLLVVLSVSICVAGFGMRKNRR